GFNQQSPHLIRLRANPPSSDRELYYRLLGSYAIAERSNDLDPIGTYEALLYWKYYSQGTAGRNIEMLGKRGSKLRHESQERLREAIAGLPAVLERAVSAIVDVVRELSEYRVPCMGDMA